MFLVRQTSLNISKFGNMNTHQIRNLVVDKIMKIEDPYFLQAINTILDHNTASNSAHILTSEQKENIGIGLNQLENGQFILNSDLEDDENKWLNE